MSSSWWFALRTSWVVTVRCRRLRVFLGGWKSRTRFYYGDLVPSFGETTRLAVILRRKSRLNGNKRKATSKTIPTEIQTFECCRFLSGPIRAARYQLRFKVVKIYTALYVSIRRTLARPVNAILLGELLISPIEFLANNMVEFVDMTNEMYCECPRTRLAFWAPLSKNSGCPLPKPWCLLVVVLASDFVPHQKLWYAQGWERRWTRRISAKGWAGGLFTLVLGLPLIVFWDYHRF